jgi:hypothetical protein
VKLLKRFMAGLLVFGVGVAFGYSATKAWTESQV